MGCDEISPDPKEPLSIEECRRAWASFIDAYWDNFVEDEVKALIPTIPQKEFDDAIRFVKFDVYKKLFWKLMEKLDLDP